MYNDIYVCSSLNNKNVRKNELTILTKNEKGLYFEFGKDKNNMKKRIYGDLETLRKDYENVKKMKEEEPKEINNINKNININELGKEYEISSIQDMSFQNSKKKK